MAKSINEVVNTMNEEQQAAFYLIIDALSNSSDSASHSDFEDADEIIHGDSSIAAAVASMSEEQKDALYLAVQAVMEDDSMEHGEGDYEVEEDEEYLTHADIFDNEFFQNARKVGSLKDAVLRHAEDYGIQDIESLFPTPTELNNPPKFINNKIEWVYKVLNGVSKSAFSRIRMSFADITDQSLRAKGYKKTGYKKETVFELMRRHTSPCTIYKKTRLDRDDIIDITDFNVVSYIKSELQVKLDEEIARAILLGDGRSELDEDKIDEECIRPIVNDEDFYCVKYPITPDANDSFLKPFIHGCIKSRKEYKGAGKPILFTTEDLLADLLLMEDNNGRIIYTSEEMLRHTLRVSEIVTVPLLEDFVRPTKDGKYHYVLGIIVNLSDYKVGADKGGATSMFDDFDIDYNQHKYLIETRRSGALTTPFSSIVIEHISDVAPASLIDDDEEDEYLED